MLRSILCMPKKTVTAAQRQSDATALITSGPVWRAVWYLAWPSAINTTILAAYSIINRIFVGYLPDAIPSQAAVGVGGNALNYLFVVATGLSAGTSALVSRSLGADRREDAVQAARQSLVMCFVLGLATGVPFCLLARWLVTLIGAKGNVLPLAADYTALIGWSTIPMFVNFIAVAVLRSQGDALSPLYAGAANIALNVVLDRVLILGLGGVPAMGIHGAAIATLVARIAAMSMSLWFLSRSALSECLHNWRVDLNWQWRILSIGWAASSGNLLMTTASSAYMHVLSMLPNGQATTALAAYGVAIVLEAIAFQPGIAFGIAAAPLVGQNLGAGKPERAVRCGWVAAGQAAAIMGLLAVLFVAIPQHLAKPFVHGRDLSLIPVIVAYLRINSFSEPFLAFNMVLRGALQGAGDTLVPMLITAFSMWAVRIPLAWLLAVYKQMGASGAWWAMSITCCLSGALMALWFGLGRWREKQV